MADGSIKIRIGASADRSIDVVFGSIEKRAQKARDTISRLFGSTGSTKSFGGVAAEAEKTFARTEKAADKAATARVRIEERANREIVRAFQRASADLQREENKRSRDAEREASKQQRLREKFADRTSHRATRFLFPPPTGILGAGRRVAGDLLRGAGVDFSIQSGVSRYVALERQSIDISNQAYQRGAKGPSGRRVAPRSIEDFSRKLADEHAMDPAEVQAGIQAFVSKNGDLATAQSAAPGLLRLAKATGASPEAVMTTAGVTASTVYKDLAGSLDEAGERAKFLFDVMNVGAGGGKLGTVEFADLAKHGPKLAASAGAYAGDRAKNLSESFALAQMGLAGGAASPAQAATSVAGFLNTLRTPARRAHFKSAGVELEDANGGMRSQQDIAIESIVAAGKDTAKFKGMWGNVQGARPLEGLRQKYLQAGGGKAGVDVLRSEFQKFGAGAALSEPELKDSHAAAMGSTASRAQKFQNNLDKITASLADRVLPALEQLAPLALNTAKAFGGVIEFTAKFPAAALAVAALTAVLRAAAESGLRAGIEKIINRAPAGALPGLPGAPGAGQVGGLGVQALRALGGAAGGAMLGAGIGQMAGDTTSGSLLGGSIGALSSGGKMGAGLGAALGIGAAVSANEGLKQQSAGLGIFDLIGGSLSGKGGFFTQIDDEMNRKAKADAAQRAVTPEQLEKKTKPTNLDANELGAAVANGIGTKTLNVRLMNPGDIKAPTMPTVDGAGRDKPVGARP